ncbi:hypothetical protein R3W88_024155 [Solanum pinnatisectum]|uniref:KIB1-4 beta-propeller domain-containing protein n=1 Tax=Solanum pinnatisectum TaxID=50273 RepID=A0AAV9LZM3_9SOLN|nr:hypothetical protein R3W88_024155 [Solanum pinnatisectum]
MELEEYKKEKYAESHRPPFSVEQQQHPWLVMCDGDVLEKQTFFSVSKNQYYMRRIPELKEKIIRAYADEWLVLESLHSSDCYLWNIISNDKIQLPPLPECKILNCALLSAPPNDPECQDVNPPTFYFCKPGYNEEFHKQDAHSIIETESGGLWTTSRLLCLDPDNDSGRITITPMSNESPNVRKYLDMGRLLNCIIQSCDDDTLLYVHLFFNGKNHRMPYNFLVFQFDFAKERWIETENIGEIAIFISHYTRTGTSCSTRGTNLNKESIYFIEDRHLYVYNLITHSISLSLPCPHVSKKASHMHWLPLPSQKK